MAHIKTYDQIAYETIIEGDSIKIKALRATSDS